MNTHRSNQGREFFQVSIEEGIAAVRHALMDAGGIESWHSQTPHALQTGDRVSVALRKGQVFALIGYQDVAQLMAGTAEPLDLWQAHSHGDVLEISAAESSSHVAGFSEGDQGSTDDPVPYLDRENSISNGMMNGRERLMPGERLVWLPAPEDAMSQGYVIFEAQAHCQIVARTWSPVIGPFGLPLLLNDFLYEGVWPGAAQGIHAALSLPRPRVWAPRGNRDQTWSLIGTEAPNPAHWLPQLKPRRRK